MKAFNRLSLLLKGVTAAFFITAPLAQAASVDTETNVPTNDSDTVIVVEGFRRDRALDAFLRGDFAAAEIGFRDNWLCILREQRQLDAALRQLSGLASSPSPRLNQQAFMSLFMPQPTDEIRERTCFNEEWQFYMMGLSQIQLGKFAEAKKSLYRAAKSKEDLMFDAHYRIGLLELLEGNIDRADRRLSYLSKLQRSCHARGVRCEVQADLETATAFLKRAIANARHETHG